MVVPDPELPQVTEVATLEQGMPTWAEEEHQFSSFSRAQAWHPAHKVGTEAVDTPDTEAKAPTQRDLEHLQAMERVVVPALSG